MLKVLFCILLATFVADIVCSSLGPGSDKEGYCKAQDLYIKEGEKEAAPLGECAELKCEDAKANIITGERCAHASHLDPGCHESKEDLTKPYPGCCPKVVCDKSKDKL